MPAFVTCSRRKIEVVPIDSTLATTLASFEETVQTAQKSEEGTTVIPELTPRPSEISGEEAKEPVIDDQSALSNTLTMPSVENSWVSVQD